MVSFTYSFCLSQNLDPILILKMRLFSVLQDASEAAKIVTRLYNLVEVHVATFGNSLARAQNSIFCLSESDSSWTGHYAFPKTFSMRVAQEIWKCDTVNPRWNS